MPRLYQLPATFATDIVLKRSRWTDRHCGSHDCQWLSQRLDRTFVIENRPGADRNLATETVVNASPDGYTLLVLGASAAINATLYNFFKFNALRDLAPIAGIVSVPDVMMTNPSVPAHTVAEFIAFAKANPGKINPATGGSGSRSSRGRAFQI